jgi:pyruvate/2-oxoglutarate dehydrogenase complex dihydrolipoamide dehydrogenase (E3) component
VVEIGSENDGKAVIAYSAVHGVVRFETRAVVLAMGCRERNRGNIGIPGSRPAGIYTAGLAQRLLNIDGCIPGKDVVIVGSGDIGMIMARRLSWVGCAVHCVVEILPFPSGLTRNIVQCLQDFGVPLHLSHTVTRIIGKDRVEGVEISPLVNGVPSPEKSFTVTCDTVLLSVGLIPENELSRKAGIQIHPDTNGPCVDHTLQTSRNGIFACGNVLHVHDLVDYVSEEAETCGKNVTAFLQGISPDEGRSVKTVAGVNCKYVVPGTCVPGEKSRFFMRSLVIGESAELTARQGENIVHCQKLNRVRPAEMISVTLTEGESQRIHKGDPVEFSITVG